MYTSTRYKMNITASKAILDGLALDGGLYLMNHIDSSFFSDKLIDYDYNQFAKTIFKLFLDDYKEEVISNSVDSCYSTHFKPQMVNIKHFDRFSLLELFNGETFAFKDMALSILLTLFFEAKKINNINKKTIILTATSGDR